MKTLDLNACGVSEMNAVEMQTVDGGSWWKYVVGLILGAASGEDTDDLKGAWNDGYDSIHTYGS